MPYRRAYFQNREPATRFLLMIPSDRPAMISNCTGGYIVRWCP